MVSNIFLTFATIFTISHNSIYMAKIIAKITNLYKKLLHFLLHFCCTFLNFAALLLHFLQNSIEFKNLYNYKHFVCNLLIISTKNQTFFKQNEILRFYNVCASPTGHPKRDLCKLNTYRDFYFIILITEQYGEF